MLCHSCSVSVECILSELDFSELGNALFLAVLSRVLVSFKPAKVKDITFWFSRIVVFKMCLFLLQLGLAQEAITSESCDTHLLHQLVSPGQMS